MMKVIAGSGIQRRSFGEHKFHTFNSQAPANTSHPARMNDLSCVLAQDQSRSQCGDENAFDKISDIVSPCQFIGNQENQETKENRRSRRGARLWGGYDIFITQNPIKKNAMKEQLRRDIEKLTVDCMRSAHPNGSNIRLRPLKLEILFLGKNGAQTVVSRRVCRILCSSIQIRMRPKLKAPRCPPQKKSTHREVVCYNSMSAAEQTASSELSPNSRRASHDSDQMSNTGGFETVFENRTSQYSGTSPTRVVKDWESVRDAYESDSASTSGSGERDDEERWAHISKATTVSSLRLPNATQLVEDLGAINDSAYKLPPCLSSEELKTRTGTDRARLNDEVSFAGNGTGVSNATDEFVPASPYKPQTSGHRVSNVSVIPQNGNLRMRSAARRHTVDQFGYRTFPREQDTPVREFKAEYLNNYDSIFPRSFKTAADPGPPLVNPGVHRQVKRRGGSPSDFYAKSWDSVLATKQDFVEDWSSYVQCKRNIETAADGTDLVSPDYDDSPLSPKLDIDLFLQDVADSIPSCKVDEVREFCRGVCLSDLLSGRGSSAQRRGAGAWLDDRVCIPSTNGESTRDYQNPLDAMKLYELLKEPRIGSADFPDADRRLIYIAGLDPYFVHALAETASFHETLVLRDAIWKHIARQTSLRVRIPSRGIPVYQLECHLPYFALRLSPPCEYAQLKAASTNTLSQWTDLSFLRLHTPKSNDPKTYVMLEAQISFVICGSNDRRWVAYAFDDTDFEGDDLAEKISPYGGFCPDPFSSDGKVDANFPIWNPREYFVMILDNRIAQALTEWESLVRAVERSIKKYRERHPSTLSDSSGFLRGRNEGVQQAFDWTRKTIELLRRLREALSGTITFWKRFNSPNGDVGYFIDNNVTDSSQNQIHLSLRAINDTFKTMEDLERTLDHMSGSCQDYAKDLQLLLTKEGSEAAKLNGDTSDFMLFVLGPIGLATGWFQLPRSMLPLPPSPQSFVIIVIAIMVAMKLLRVVSGATPGFQWWWKMISALMKMMRLEGMGDLFPLGFCSKLVRRIRHRPTDRIVSNGDILV